MRPMWQLRQQLLSRHQKLAACAMMGRLCDSVTALVSSSSSGVIQESGLNHVIEAFIGCVTEVNVGWRLSRQPRWNCHIVFGTESITRL